MSGVAALAACAAVVVAAASSAAATPARTAATPQTIAVKVNAPANAAYNHAFSVAASASSGLEVAYSSGGSCTNVGDRFTVTSGAGTCQVKYDQAGNATYDPAPQVVELVVAKKADQTIDFEPLGPKTAGDEDFVVVALATSDLPVTLTASGSCRISAGILHITGPGTCTVTGKQAGDANYNAAPAESRTFTISRAKCKVPKLVGRSLGAAKSALAKGHCRTGKVRSKASRKPKGLVLAQARRAGLVLAPDAEVDLVVSSGRRK
jgi:hypothetical protein